MRNDFTKEQLEVVKNHLSVCPWHVIETNCLKEDIEKLTSQIVGDSGGELTEEERKRLIDLRQIYKFVLELPKRILKSENNDFLQSQKEPKWMSNEDV